MEITGNIGITIRNRNGSDYHLFATNGIYSLVHGENEYIVVTNIFNTPDGYAWSEGTYFGNDFVAAVTYYKKRTKC